MKSVLVFHIHYFVAAEQAVAAGATVVADVVAVEFDSLTVGSVVVAMKTAATDVPLQAEN